MIFEFALDPCVLSNWQSFRYFYESFGVDQGRLISRFPKRWKRMVYEACGTCQEIEKKKIEERLIQIDKKLLKNNRKYNSSQSWLINAKNQHNICPFRAIIADSNPDKSDYIIIADEVNDDVSLWHINRQNKIPRKAENMANCVLLLFRISKEIIFVDPHFAPEMNRYRRTFKRFIELANNECQNPMRIEFHLEEKSDKNFFSEECKKEIQPLIPKGIKISFIRWKQIEGSESLHPRFILTNRGGIHFDYGLDDGSEGETTLVSLLEDQLYQSTWKDFQKETSPFEFVDELNIVG